MQSIYAVGKGRRAGRQKGKDSTEEPKKSPGSIRMQMDMSELALPDNCKIALADESNLMEFRITVCPDAGYWKGSSFTFKFKVPDNYPHQPPKVVCETPVYHPNIDLNGAVCLNILKDDWRPILNTQNIVHGLIFLFLEPNPADPLNHKAAQVLRESSVQFKSNVQKALRGGVVDGHRFPGHR